MSEPARNVPLTAEDAKLLVRGDWLTLYGEPVRFDHATEAHIMAVGTSLLPFHRFTFLARPADPNDPEGWVGIESAPKDGTIVDLCYRSGDYRAEHTGAWQSLVEGWRFDDGGFLRRCDMAGWLWRPHTPAPAGEGWQEANLTASNAELLDQALSHPPLKAPTPPSNGYEGALKIVRDYFVNLSSMPPNEHPHWPSGTRPFGTGDVRHLAECLTSALSALSASQEREARACAELDAISGALGGDARFMDPPDGGDVPLAEQVRRCRAAFDEAEEREARAREALEPFAESALGYGDSWTDEMVVRFWVKTITVGDLRKARVALQSLKETK